MYSLKPDIDSSLLSKAKSGLINLEKCLHSKKISINNRENCFYCGIHLSKVRKTFLKYSLFNNIQREERKTYKTTNYSFKVLMDLHNFCENLFSKRLMKETYLKPTHPYYKVFTKKTEKTNKKSFSI